MKITSPDCRCHLSVECSGCLWRSSKMIVHILTIHNKKAVLSQGNRTMPSLIYQLEIRDDLVGADQCFSATR